MYYNFFYFLDDCLATKVEKKLFPGNGCSAHVIYFLILQSLCFVIFCIETGKIFCIRQLKMEKGQSEVTSKIRSAIKQKLAELCDFIDDELPEYIMIMVANQRSRSQVEKDLSLFLRNDTMIFTNWLWDLLNNLKSGSKAIQPTGTNIEADILKKDIEADDDAVVLDFYPDEHETDFLSQEDTNDGCFSKFSVLPSLTNDGCISKFSVLPSLTNEVKKETSLPKSTQSVKAVERKKIKISAPQKVTKRLPNYSSKEFLSSAVIPIKKKFKSSEDEYDPTKPEYEKSSHISKTRNYGGPAALQANKLLLKAVDDATKSILKGKNMEEFYKPTPIKVLTSSKQQDISKLKRDNILSGKKSAAQELLSNKRTATEKVLSEPESMCKLQITDSVMSEYDSNEYPPDVVMEDDSNDLEVSQTNRTIHLKSLPSVSGNRDYENSYNSINNYPFSFDTVVEEVHTKSPHFIVTLDGANKTTFKRKFEENNGDSFDEDDDEIREDTLTEEVGDSPEKLLKLNERCKYWPACKNSDQCAYHHPTTPCKCFPDCKFGDKCLYIHPNCKFDALCSRKECPFTHASKRKLPLTAVPVKMVPLPIKSRKINIVCKFYPQCTSKRCPFIHPKLCRYGTGCRSPACLFSHFPVPSRSQLKWQATVS